MAYAHQNLALCLKDLEYLSKVVGSNLSTELFRFSLLRVIVKLLSLDHRVIP